MAHDTAHTELVDPSDASHSRWQPTVVASAAVMAVLYVGKMPVAVRMQSRSLRAEAVESQLCELQDLTFLIGLGLNSLFS